MDGPALAAIKARFILSLSEKSRQDLTIKTDGEEMNQLLRRYDSEAAIAKADKKIRVFKQGSQKLSVLKLRCVGIYNEQALGSFLVEAMVRSICSIMRR